MILTASGQPTSSIVDAFATRVADEPKKDVAPPKKRTYRPSPGKVTVVRKEINRFLDEAQKIVDPFADDEDYLNIYATVVSIGDPTEHSGEVWFDTGADVTITVSAFQRVELMRGEYVWVGPWAGVSGVFVDEEVE